MATEPTVTIRHLEMLGRIADTDNGLWFDLEVQELAEFGLIYDDRGSLRLTALGKATLRLVRKLNAA